MDNVCELLRLKPGSNEAIFAKKLFHNTLPEDAIEEAERLFPEFIDAKNDGGLEMMIDMVIKLRGKITQTTLDRDKHQLAELDYLEKLYLQIPDDDRFPETKRLLIRRISDFWNSEMNEVSVRAFSILCAIFEPPKYRETRTASEQTTAQIHFIGRKVSEAEQKEIGAVLVNKLRDFEAFDHRKIEVWMRRQPGNPDIPDQIITRLESAWVRNGGDLKHLMYEVEHLREDREALWVHWLATDLTEDRVDLHCWAKVKRHPDSTKPWEILITVLRLKKNLRDTKEQIVAHLEREACLLYDRSPYLRPVGNSKGVAINFQIVWRGTFDEEGCDTIGEFSIPFTKD